MRNFLSRSSDALRPRFYPPGLTATRRVSPTSPSVRLLHALSKGARLKFHRRPEPDAGDSWSPAVPHPSQSVALFHYCKLPLDRVPDQRQARLLLVSNACGSRLVGGQLAHECHHLSGSLGPARSALTSRPGGAETANGVQSSPNPTPA